jgi:hypothetical protein
MPCRVDFAGQASSPPSLMPLMPAPLIWLDFVRGEGDEKARSKERAFACQSGVGLVRCAWA